MGRWWSLWGASDLVPMRKVVCQVAPTLFVPVKAATTEQVEALEQLRALWHGHAIAVHTAAQAPGPGVDTPEDLARVRHLWAQTALN